MTDILATSRHRRDRHYKETIIDRHTHHKETITDRDRHYKGSITDRDRYSIVKLECIAFLVKNSEI